MATYIYTTARFIGSHTHQHIIFTSASGTNQVHVLYVIINPQHKIHIFARCTERDPQGESNGELKKAAVCMYQLSMISSQLCKYHICMYVCIVCTVWSTLNQHSAFCAASPPHCPSIHQPASSPAQCHSHPAAPLGHKPGWHRRNRCSNASTVQLGTLPQKSVTVKQSNTTSTTNIINASVNPGHVCTDRAAAHQPFNLACCMDTLIHQNTNTSRPPHHFAGHNCVLPVSEVCAASPSIPSAVRNTLQTHHYALHFTAICMHPSCWAQQP
jgi:hypothetical protein